MDIDEVDLQQLFEMIDVDGSGSIEAAEFIAPLSRWAPRRPWDCLKNLEKSLGNERFEGISRVLKGF